MKAFLDGAFLPADEVRVSVLDRGFLYGDGLFETIRCYEGLPFAWARHMERLARGAACLRLPPPLDDAALLGAALRLLRENGLGDAILRVQMTRGPGPRGYSPRGAGPPTLVITTHPAAPVSPEAPARWRLATSPFRLPAGDPLAEFKGCSRLLNVLARQRAEEAGADEALLLNTDGHVAEAASGNVCWFAGGAWHTPPTAAGALAGVTRAVVMDVLSAAGRPMCETSAPPAVLHAAEAVVVTSTGLEIIRVTELDGRPLPAGPAADALHRAYRDEVRAALGRKLA
jgi:branched-chain amino acid aminotransferase